MFKLFLQKGIFFFANQQKASFSLAESGSLAFIINFTIYRNVEGHLSDPLKLLTSLGCGGKINGSGNDLGMIWPAW